MENALINNCFNWTISKLQKNKYIKDDSFMIYGTRFFFKNTTKLRKWHLRLNHHNIFFSQFCKMVESPQKGDILTHSMGVGIVCDREHFRTLDHFGSLKIYPIEGDYTLWRVENGR